LLTSSCNEHENWGPCMTVCCSAEIRVLAPLVLRIFPLQLRLNSRVVLAPEIREVLSDLHGPHTWRQDVYAERNAAHRNFWCLCPPKQFLYPQRNKRRAIGHVCHLRRPAVRQPGTLGRVLVEQFPLVRRQPRLHDGFHLAIFKIFVAKGSETKLLDN